MAPNETEESIPLREPRIPGPCTGVSAEKFTRLHSPAQPAIHAHNFIEMIYLIEGSLVNRINGHAIPQSPGELTIITRGSYHELDFKDVTYFNLYLYLDTFPLSMIPPRLSDYILPLLVPSRDFLHKQNHIRKIGFRNPGKINGYFEQMANESIERQSGWDQSVLNLAVLLLIECARSVMQDQPQEEFLNKKELHPDTVISHVCAYLDTGYQESISLPKLAALSGYEEHYLCTKFKKFTGLTISQYVHQRRIRQAMYLLKISNASVTVIAGKCGYDDPGYFNRQFKRFTGMSPGEFRRQ